MGKEITSLVNTEVIEINRYYFSTLIDVVAFLATHKLTFREKIDAFESEDERGIDSFSVWLFTLLKTTSVYVLSLELSRKMQRTLVPMCKMNLLLLCAH